MKAIRITCPTCLEKGTLNVDDGKIKNSERGVTAINIKENTICKHSFVAYIDRNLVARDCFAVDFTIKLPEIEMKENEGNYDADDFKDLDIYLITLNLRALTIASIFRGIFLKQKNVLINDITIIDAHIFKLLDYCFEGTFEYDLSIISKKEYKNDKKKYKNHLIISKDTIINDPEKLLASKKMKIENAIVQKFLSIPDTVSGLIILKNDIFKAHEIAKDAFNFVSGLSDNERKNYSIYELAEHINDHAGKLNIKLQKVYLDFLVDIIMYYFELDISKEVKPKDFLGYL